MFKNNYIQKLAFDNIKKQKSLYQFIFASFVLIFFLSTIMILLFSSFEDITYQEKYQRYGKWSVAIENDIQQDINASIKGYVYQIGDINYQEKDVGQLISVDQNAQDLLSFSCLKGRMPLQENEIAIEEDQLIALGLSNQLNQTITFYVNHQIQQYQLVGIIQNYSQSHLLSLGTYITTNVTSPQYIMFCYDQDNLKLWNELVDQNLENLVTINTNTYDQYIKSSTHYEKANLTFLVQITVLFIGLCGIIGTMTSSMGKREEHLILMRAIGATSKQIQKMVVYEGLMLMLGGSLLGISLGFIISIALIEIYHLLMNAPFILTVKSIFFIQMLLSLIIAIIGVLFPIWNIKFIPLVGRISQKMRYKKVRKVRKTNIWTLAIREINQNKMMSMILIGVVSIGIGSCYFCTNSIDTYYSSLKQYEQSEDYDYMLKSLFYDDVLMIPSEIQQLMQIPGISSQVVHQKELYINWNGISKGMSDIFNEDMNKKFSMVEDAYMIYYENEDAFKDILQKYHYQGSFPTKENEVIVIKPHFYKGQSGYGSSIEEDKSQQSKEYIDNGLEIGQKINAIQKNNEKIIDNDFKIVGTLTFDTITEKESHLFEAEYLLITNKETYHQYFLKDDQQHLLFDIDDPKNITEFKQTILTLSKKYSHYDYIDTLSRRILQKMEIQEDFIKNVSFTGIIFVGIMILTYIYRKMNAISSRHEIGLYRAIGMTRKQIYGMYVIYASIMFILSFFLFFIGYFVVILYWTGPDNMLYEYAQILLNPMCICLYVSLLILFIIVVLLPIRGLLQERLLKYLNYE